jgi:hypothetical protein
MHVLCCECSFEDDTNIGLDECGSHHMTMMNGNVSGKAAVRSTPSLAAATGVANAHDYVSPGSTKV